MINSDSDDSNSGSTVIYTSTPVKASSVEKESDEDQASPEIVRAGTADAYSLPTYFELSDITEETSTTHEGADNVTMAPEIGAGDGDISDAVTEVVSDDKGSAVFQLNGTLVIFAVILLHIFMYFYLYERLSYLENEVKLLHDAVMSKDFKKQETSLAIYYAFDFWQQLMQYFWNAYGKIAETMNSFFSQ